MTDEFRALLQDFIRRFGLLNADQTPCGKPLASSDAHALMLLLDAGEAGMLGAALAARLGVDKSTASRTASRLIDAGHVTATPSPNDARARPLRLTKKGQRIARDVQGASRDRFSRLLEQVPASRRPNVLAALGDLVTALHHLDGEGHDS